MTIGIDKIGFATSQYVLRLSELAAALSGLSAANGPQRYRTYHQRQCTGGAYCRPEHRAPLSGRQMFGAGRLLLRSRRLPGGGQHPVIQPGGGLDMLHQILIVVLLHGRLLPAGL